MRKFLIFLVLAATVGAVGWKYFTTGTDVKQKRKGPGSVAVETAVIQRADLGDRVLFTGSVKAEERYDAAPKIAGIVEHIFYNVGDSVKKGDVLAILDDDEYVLAVEQAEANLRVAMANANDAESQLEIARRDFDRMENLRNERVISVQDYDKADATLKAAEAKFETSIAQERLSQAALKTAEVKLGYTRIRANWEADPDERVIGARMVDPGALVAANTPILSILDISTVRAIIPVSEKEYPKIVMHGPVTVTSDAFPGKIFPGEISRIPQELGNLSREAEIEIAINNRERLLKPGMFVRANIEFERANDAVAVPQEAIVRRDDGRRGVYIVNDEQNQAAFQPIVEGIVDGKFVQAIDGDDLLGREVVVLGQHLLKDGIGIRVADNTAGIIAPPGKTGGPAEDPRPAQGKPGSEPGRQGQERGTPAPGVRSPQSTLPASAHAAEQQPDAAVTAKADGI